MTETQLAPPPDTRTLPLSPYKGLFPYTEADAAFFFGRATERELIAANLMAARLTLLYGPSGVGKSSVIDAGVTHVLAERERDAVEEDDAPNIALVVFRTWRGEPAAGLAAAVATSVRRVLPDRDFSDPPADATLTDVLAHWSHQLGGRLLIVLDQFEEYFVYSRPGDRFDVEFPRAVNHAELRANFLVTIREDALAKLDRFKGRIPYLFDNYLRLDRLDLAAARLAIVEPLRVWARLGEEDVAVEERLVDDVLEQIGPDVTFGQAGAGTADGQRADQVETSFLQLVMKKVWEVERAAGSSVLRASTLERLGGAKGIVRTHLTEGLNRLDPEEKEVAAHLFQFLVTRSGQKVAHTASDLADFSGDDPAAVRQVLERLASRDVWILRRVEASAGEEGSEGSYEIYHDTLGEPILAWRSAYLQHTHERAAREETRKARRRATLFAAGAGLMLLVAAACLVLYFRAADARRSARSQKLVAQSAVALGVDPDAAVRLAGRALGLEKTADAEKAFRKAVGFSPLRVVIRHDGDVYRTQYSADGSRVLSIGSDGKAIVSDARTGRSFARLGDGSTLLTGDLSGDGHRVMTAGADGRIRFWSVDSGRLLRTFRSPGLTGASLDPKDPSKVVATSSDGRARIWRLGSATPIVSRRLTPKRLAHSAFSPDGTRILVTGDDEVAWILDAKTGQELRALQGHTASINVAAWSADGSRIGTGADDGFAVVWDAATGAPEDKFSEPGPVTAVAFNADGSRFAAAGGDRIHVYSVRKARQVAELRGNRGTINEIDFRKGGEVLVTASSDGTARVWDYAELTEATLRPLLGDRSGVDNAVFSPDGRFVLTGSTDGTARIWAVSTGTELWHKYGAVTAAAWSPDGKRIVTSNDFKYYLWNGSGRFVRFLPEGPSTSVSSIRFGAQGRLLATAESSGVVYIRRTSDWKIVTRITLPAPVTGTAFNPDGSRLAITRADGWAGIYGTRGGNPVLGLHAVKNGPAHPLGSATGVDWSADGRFVVTTGTDGFVEVWDATSGHLLTILRGHVGRVQSPSFARRSDLVVTAGADHTARVWNVATQKPVAKLEGDAPITTAAFSPDESRVVTGDATGVTEVWDWRHEKLLGALPMHADLVTSVSFSPDGRILSSSDDQTAKIYSCDTCLPLDRLRDLVDRRERIIGGETP